MVCSIKYKEFSETIWDYYAKNRRELVWRTNINPYAVVVSEIMLQQTQVDRVATKFPEFIAKFDSFSALATASSGDVVRAWQGLGYNRRALYIHRLAQEIIIKYGGVVPNDPEVLEQLSGIGPATARSIVAFAYNIPTIFIETNIRAVFIHHFFDKNSVVHDRDILPLVRDTVDLQNPREWYYALMDYGVMLKKKYQNPARSSQHYVRQSKFEGSDRQIRGAVLRACADTVKYNFIVATYSLIFKKKPADIVKIINALMYEGFIQKCDDILKLQS